MGLLWPPHAKSWLIGKDSDAGRDWGQEPDPSSKATLWVKAQHEGALPPPCIVRNDPRVPHISRGDRDLGVAFQTHPRSQASPRGEGKDSALLSSRDGYVLESTE